MIQVDHVILSDDIKDHFFVCHTEKCRGACCVEGDLGAPLEEAELPLLEAAYEQVKPYLMPEGIAAIEKQGKYVLDEDGEYSTTTIDGAECAFAVYDEEGTLQCGIEQAYNNGKTTFQKPISCHLYPIRVKKYEGFEALNYNRWHICKSACSLGEKLRVPLYRFLKEALVRKYGAAWYDKLVSTIEEEK